MTHHNLNRRSFVAGLTALMGSAFVAENTMAIEAAVAYQGGAKGKILNAQQLEMVKLIAEIIIPETDTPGAIAADVHGYIDYMVADFMPESQRQEFLADLAKIDAQAGGFLKLSAQAQTTFIEKLDAAAYMRGASWRKYGHYKMLKGWVSTGFSSSEVGMTEAWNYNPLPGALREVTRSEWLEHHGWAKGK